MSRLLLISLLLCAASLSWAQSKEISLGVFSGITAPFTWDEGIYRDSRYKARYDIKIAPFGMQYGLDYDGFGFVLNPSLITIGQNYQIINTVGGHEGTRKINMKYVDVAAALKLHMIDLSFFRVSFVVGAGIGYLLSGKEIVSHNNAKLRFPLAVYPILPSEYVVEYDGVLAPQVDEFPMLRKDDFNTLQLFVATGIRSDWDVTENWRVSLDVRVNYGVKETRSDSYLQRLENNQTLYDIAGDRREIFVHLNIGISRYIESENDNGNSKYKSKSSKKKFTPRPKLPPTRKN